MDSTRRWLLGGIAGVSFVGLAACIANGNGGGNERVVVENRTVHRQVVRVQVLDDARDSLVDGRYSVPRETGIQFERIFDYGSYTLRARPEGGEWATMEWTPRDCAATSNPAGNMHAGVVFDDAGMDLVQNTCEELVLGQSVDEYLPALQFQVETTTTAA